MKRTIRAWIFVTTGVVWLCACPVIRAATSNEDWKTILAPLPVPEQNGWYEWIERTKELPVFEEPDSDFLYSVFKSGRIPAGEVRAQDVKKAARLLKPSFRLLNELSLGPEDGPFYVPVLTPWELTPGWTEFMEFVRRRSYQAWVLAMRGKTREATTVAASMVIFGGMVTRESRSLAGFQTGIAMMETGTELIEWLLSRPTLKAPQIEILRNSLLEAESASLEGCVAALTADYNSDREYQSLARAWGPVGYLSDLAAVSHRDFSHLNTDIVHETIGRRVFNIEDTFTSYGRPLALYVQWLETFPVWEPNKSQRLWEEEIPRSAKRKEEFGRSIHRVFAANEDEIQLLSAIEALLEEFPNPMGREFAASRIAGAHFAGFTAYFRTTELRALALIATIRLRLLQGRNLPKSLNELVQSDSTDLNLTDPFSGNQFLYSPERQILWSVGADRFDDGGKIEGPRIVSPDFVWSLSERLMGGESN